MRRFFVDKIDEKILLTGEDHQHLAFVLRAKSGERVVLCPQDGYDYQAEIVSVSKSHTELRILEKIKNELEPSVQLDLFMSLVKGDKLDTIVQKATELGVNAVYPLHTRFVQVKPESVKIERLNRIVAEAAKQCGRGILPTVQPVLSFNALPDRLRAYDLVVFPYEKSDGTDLLTYLTQTISCGNLPKRVAVIIGSEGGFADEEAAALIEVGVCPLTLGKRILRAETAGITVTAVVMYALGQWR